MKLKTASGDCPLRWHGGTLADALSCAGYPLNTRCGQRGWCRGCEVALSEGDLVRDDGKRIAAPAVIKACRFTKPDAEAAIRVPDRSRLVATPHLADGFVTDVPVLPDPLVDAPPGTIVCAVDLGTTTVVVMLFDPWTGEPIAREGGYNAQMAFGDNVVTRMEAASDPEKRAAMQTALIGSTLVPLLEKAIGSSKRLPEDLAGIIVAGNTTMLHLFVGEDPSPMGRAPFTPRFLRARALRAADVRLDMLLEGISPSLPIHLLPGFSAYVGADLAAGALATGMDLDPEPSLLVDLGTNGEIVLQAEGRFYVAATAAGPAFEGCGLISGLRAQEGAVSKISIEGPPWCFSCETVGGVPAQGICGSAYLDFMALGRAKGLLEATGRFSAAGWAGLREETRAQAEGRHAIRIAGDALIGDADVALLLQAKAAIGAGIETLLEVAGLPAIPRRIYLAGGFGLQLNTRHAITCGLLPGAEPHAVRVVGNTSLAGAWLAMRDRSLHARLAGIVGRVSVVDLNTVPSFEDRYIDHLRL